MVKSYLAKKENGIFIEIPIDNIPFCIYDRCIYKQYEFIGYIYEDNSIEFFN